MNINLFLEKLIVELEGGIKNAWSCRSSI
jgi:hypothetical protein